MTQPILYRWLPPEARRLERHAIRVHAPPDVAYAALLAVTLADVPLVRALFWLRRLPHTKDQTLRELFTTRPFFLLEEAPNDEAVFAVGTSLRSRPETPEALASLRRGMIAIANLCAVTVETGTRLETETWVATYGRATPLFRLYWLFVGPFSAFTRRRFLAAAKRNAER